MRIPLPPPQWRVAIVFVIALVVSGVIGLPLILRGLLFGGIVIAQTLVLWRSFGPNRPGAVTYWRGVRYESKRNGTITLADIQDNAIALLTWVLALLLTCVFVLRYLGY